MIKYSKGDLLQKFKNGEVNCILHCCNCRGVMGSGIALQIKNQFFKAYLAYKDYEREKGLNLGSISAAETAFGPIYNLHAQENYGTEKRQVNYEALYVCLEKTKEDLINYNFKGTIGIPYKIASDRAGGDWDIVWAMIDSVFRDFEVEIVEYQK